MRPGNKHGEFGLKATKISLIFTISVLVSFASWATVPASQSITLKPNMEQRFASNLATKFLTNWHYKDTRLDNSLSSDIFDGYVDLLDPNRSYFLASDVASFERFRDGLDDALRHSDSSFKKSWN